MVECIFTRFIILNSLLLTSKSKVIFGGGKLMRLLKKKKKTLYMFAKRIGWIRTNEDEWKYQILLNIYIYIYIYLIVGKGFIYDSFRNFRSGNWTISTMILSNLFWYHKIFESKRLRVMLYLQYFHNNS